MEKNKFVSFFFFSLNQAIKAAEIACGINQAFGIGTTTEFIAQWWFKKFCARDESLEDDKCSGWPLDIDND